MNSKFVSLATIMVLALLSIASGAQDRAGPAELRATTSTTSSPASPAAPAPTHATAPDALVIGPGDLLEVSLYGIQDFKAEARVGSNQQVSLPMLGSVTVGGLTTDQAEKVIADKLVAARLYNNPQVQVLVKEYTSEGISVLGEVQKPGIYQLLGARRLYDAISSAGGMTKTAGRFVLITHRDDPEHSTRVPVSTDAKSVADNVPLQAGDTVVVSKAGLVYVVGDVHMAGGFVMENDKNITVLQAIALAQGLGPNPSLNSAKLIRTTPSGRQDVPLELKKILTAKAPDMQLQADDIVFIPDSATKSGAKQSLQSIVQMATGIAIWRFP